MTTNARMHGNYRHLSESSDGSANTKSTQTTTLGSINGLENNDKQLATLKEMDIEYGDATTNSDTELDINCNLLSEKRPLAKDPDNHIEETFVKISDEINHETTQCDRGIDRKQPQNKSQIIECSCICVDEVENGEDKHAYCVSNIEPSCKSKHPCTNDIYSDKIQTKTLQYQAESESKYCDSKIDNQNNDHAKQSHNIQGNYNIPDQMPSYDLCSSWNNTSPCTYVDLPDDKLSTPSKTRSHEVTRLLERDRTIHELQYGTNLMKMFEERYRSILEDMNRKQELLKASLMWLTVMFIVIILCVAVSMIYSITRNTGHIGMFDVEKSIERYMSSQEAREDMRRHVMCADCSDVSADVLPLFTRDKNNECCIRDIATLTVKMEESFSADLLTQNTRLTNLKEKLYKLQQTANFRMVVVHDNKKNQTENVVELDTLLENSLAKINKNEQLINSLLDRRRWSGHWIGRKDEADDRMIWNPTGNTDQQKKSRSPTISVEGGIYFVYGAIRFSCRQTSTRISVGYSIDEIGSRGGPQSLASVNHECSNGTTVDQDLILQRIIYIPVNQAKKIKLSLVGPNTSISSAYEHSFGIFEI